MPNSLPPQTRAWAEVDLEAIRANIMAVRAYIGPRAQVMAVVKGDAYGHGLVPVGQAAEAAGAAWLGVATVAEGVALRWAGVRAPIAVLCAPAPGEAEILIAHLL